MLGSSRVQYILQLATFYFTKFEDRAQNWMQHFYHFFEFRYLYFGKIFTLVVKFSNISETYWEIGTNILSSIYPFKFNNRNTRRCQLSLGIVA